jgi:hypothetical protein
MLDDARFYRDLGFSELPLDGKLPAIPHWKHLTRRYPTDCELRVWFQNTRNNIGIICGQISGVVVLDADTQDLADSLAQQLPPTAMMTKTAHGRHYFYRLEKHQHIPPRVRINHLMLDVRGEVSYVVAAPSIHPQTGDRYQRIGSWNLQEVPYFDPAWIPATRPDLPISRGNVKNPLSYILRIRAVSGAGGSNATFRAACIVRDAGFSEAEALAAMIEWNQTNAEPAWSVRELLHKVQDAFSKLPGKRGVP